MNPRRFPGFGCRSAIALLVLAAIAAAAEQGRQPIQLRSKAPELTGGPWIGTADGKPLTLASRLGKVTVVHFWTFG